MSNLNRALKDKEIERKIERAPELASLRSINAALSDLIYSDNSFTSQIAEIVRRDPSLMSRLLRMVNSVFFGLTHRVSNIEDAIFYLGLRQIRELALATPVIEDLSTMHGGMERADWRSMWQHSIGSAILTREALAVSGLGFEDDTDYIVGLVHNVGKIVMAHAFPDEFAELLSMSFETLEESCEAERKLVGWDHARIGARYLRRHGLDGQIIEAVEFHNCPAAASDASGIAAAVHIADAMTCSIGVRGIENVQRLSDEAWTSLKAWDLIFPPDDQAAQERRAYATASLRRSLGRMPSILRSMV